MKSDEDKLYIKFVELDEIYNFVDDAFLFKVVWMSENMLVSDLFA